MLKRMLPAAEPLEFETGSIDKATETWLNANYLQRQRRPSFLNTNNSYNNTNNNNTLIDPSIERIRLQNIAEKQTVVTIDHLNSWNFDLLEYTIPQLCEVLTYLFSIHNFFDEFKVPAGSFHAFVIEISTKYSVTNTYHNFKHGCDVCHTIHRFMNITRLASGKYSVYNI